MNTPHRSAVANAYKPYAREIVREVCAAILGDDTDDEIVTRSADELSENGNLSDVIARIAGSRGAWERNLYQRPEELVRLAYRGVLGREPDPTGMTDYSKLLVETKDFAALLSILARSREHWEKFLIP